MTNYYLHQWWPGLLVHICLTWPECEYLAHHLSYNCFTRITAKMVCELVIDTPGTQLTQMVELWCVCCEDSGENLLCCNGASPQTLIQWLLFHLNCHHSRKAYIQTILKLFHHIMSVTCRGHTYVNIANVSFTIFSDFWTDMTAWYGNQTVLWQDGIFQSPS